MLHTRVTIHLLLIFYHQKMLLWLIQLLANSILSPILLSPHHMAVHLILCANVMLRTKLHHCFELLNILPTSMRDTFTR